MMYVSESHCARLHGGGVRECICFLPNKGGFIECPPVARTVLQHRPAPSPRPQPTLAGEFCADCGSPNVTRAGTCMLCRDCGSTSGGCS